MAGIFGTKAPSNATIQAASGMRVQTSLYGLPVALMWGTVRAPVNVLWWGDFQAFQQESQAAGGKGGGGSVVSGYTYQTAVAMALGEGPVQAIQRIWVGKDLQTLSGLNLTLLDGGTGQTPWGYLTTFHPGEDLVYPGLAYVASGSYQLGTSPDLSNHTFEVQAQLATPTQPDANPANVLADFLAHPRYGVPGFSLGMLAGLTDYHDYCALQGLMVSPLWSEPKPAAEYVAQLLRITNCDAVASQGTLRLLPRVDQASLFAIDGDELLQVVHRTSTAAGSSNDDAYNVVRVNGLNRDYDYNPDPSTASDQVSIDTYGRRELPTIEAREYCNVDSAQRAAQLILQRGLYVRQRYTVHLPITRSLYEPGDVGSIPYRGRQVDVRIIDVQRDGEAITWTCEDYLPGLGDAAGISGNTAGGSGINYLTPPGPTVTPRFLNSLSWLTNGEAQIWMAVSGTGAWGGVHVWVSQDGTSYRRIGVHRAKSRYGTLTAALAAPTADPDVTNTATVQLLDTSGQMLNVSDGVAQGNGTLCLVDDELFTYVNATLVSSGRYGLSRLYRGRKSTATASHASGAPVTRLDGGIFRYTYDQALIGTTVYIKLTAFNIYGGAEEDLSTATPYTITLAPVAPPAGATADYISWGTAG